MYAGSSPSASACRDLPGGPLHEGTLHLEETAGRYRSDQCRAGLEVYGQLPIAPFLPFAPWRPEAFSARSLLESLSGRVEAEGRRGVAW